MKIYVKGIGVTAPHFPNWEEMVRFFCGKSELDPAFLPKPQAGILPAVERRRSSVTVKLAVDAASEALQQSGMKPQEMASVFASSNGDTDTIHQICETLATAERFVSPTRFHNSVHNAPAGYWSIATGSMQPSSSISAGMNSFAAGLLEAAVQCLTERTPALFVAYDTPFPAPLYAITPGHRAFGVAMIIDAEPTGALAELNLALEADPGIELSKMGHPELEALRIDSSASRALPLLAAIAAEEPQEIALAYSDDFRLMVFAKTVPQA